MDQQPLTVVVVEDDSDIAELVRVALASEGFRVETYTDGRAALERLKQGRPDLLVLDLMLPDVDGLELCAQVRALQPEEPYLPVLMLTALDTPAYKALGFARGADDYITKPFDVPELVARVRAWGGASRRIRELYALRERWEAERQAAQDQAIRHMAMAIPDAVNQSLSEVYGYAELLANRPGADPDVRELSERLRAASQRLLATVDRLANAAHYVTKHYGRDIEVLDVDRAGEQSAQPTSS